MRLPTLRPDRSALARVGEMKGFPGAAVGPVVREALKAAVPAGI